MKQSLLLYNLRYEKLCDLVNDGEYSARRITESSSLNQITQLSFEIPLQNPNTHYIINENLIFFNDEFYRIKTPSIKHNEDGSTVLTVNCSHLSETLQSNVITMDEITPKTVVELMKIALVYNGSTPTLGWSVGNVTVDLTKRRGLERSEQSSFSHLCIIAEKYDGILVFNSKTRKVDLIPRVDVAKPDFELSVYKNLKGIEISYDSSEMVTRLYCFGGNDANGNEINIITPNPLKKGYVENYDYFFHLGYTPSDILAHPELFIKTSVWRDTNYYLPSDLYDDGVDKLETLAKPKIDVKVEALDLSQFPEYKSVPLSLGEAINVRDEDLGISFICNIISRTINYDEPHILNIELTNQIDYKNLLSELFTKVSTASQVISSGAGIKGSAVDGINTDQIRDINAKYASFEYLDANYIDATNLAAQYAKILDLDVINADIENLKVDKLEADDLSVINADIENLKTNKADITDLTAINADITSLQVSKLEATDLDAINADISDLKVDKADVTDLTAINGEIENLKTTKLEAKDLTAISAEIDNLYTNKAEITDLSAAVAEIGVLDTDLATIKTLVNGNLTSENIQSLNLTSANTTIANAMIKDAMIDDLSVDKLKAGDISTNKFNIVSDSGNFIIADNTIQISDGTTVRVQIGKDASGDYNMYVCDINGKLMFDATGIKEDAIKSAIIRDDMVSPTANIDASKIDINTLFNVINNDGSHTINGSKIVVDTEGQTLDVKFNSITTLVDEAKSTAETANTNVGVVQGKINTVISQSGINELENEGTTLYDKYTTTEQTLDGITNTVGEHTSVLQGKADSDYVDNLVDSVVSVTQTQIRQTQDSLTADLDKKISDLNGDITQSYSADIQATVDNFNMSFSNIQSTIENNNQNITNLNQYFDFSTSGMEIGKTGSPLKINISNEEMQFKEGEAVVAYINGLKMYISNLDVVDSLEVGNHKIEKFNDEITIIRFIG